jgi:GTP-binding protein
MPETFLTYVKQSPDSSADALAWTHTARFVTTASQLQHLPEGDLPEIAFVGRSNAGKSTAINALAHRRQLAFASKTPGRTQHINLFALGPKDAADTYLADLPGYGYATVSRTEKVRWQKVMADYLEVRRNLHGVVLLVDSRLGLTPLDERLLEFIAPRINTGEVKMLVVLTKADKLNRKEQTAALNAVQEQLASRVSEQADVGVLLFSATKQLGLGDLAETIKSWVHAADVSAGAPQSAEEVPSGLSQEG